MAPFYFYFAGIGLGFLMIEISQLQRLSIFLGHPTYALTVVLFSVLLSSGIGSMLSEQIIRVSRPASLLAPLVAFLLVQNGGYLVAFTASGQTLGKMIAGIRVVSSEPRSPMDLGRAFVRELVWLGLAIPAGLGLLTVLSRDRRGVHDRFAGTRVVRASVG